MLFYCSNSSLYFHNLILISSMYKVHNLKNDGGLLQMRSSKADGLANRVPRAFLRNSNSVAKSTSQLHAKLALRRRMRRRPRPPASRYPPGTDALNYFESIYTCVRPLCTKLGTAVRVSAGSHDTEWYTQGFLFNLFFELHRSRSLILYVDNDD